MIPRLVETVKAMPRMRRHAEEVIKARNSAMSATGTSEGSAAENQMKRCASRLIALRRPIRTSRPTPTSTAVARAETVRPENRSPPAAAFLNSAVHGITNTGFSRWPAALFAGMLAHPQGILCSRRAPEPSRGGAAGEVMSLLKDSLTATSLREKATAITYETNLDCFVASAPRNDGRRKRTLRRSWPRTVFTQYRREQVSSMLLLAGAVRAGLLYGLCRRN